MKAIVLAAGRGSRMRDGTKNIPKCMIKLWGKTLLEHCLNVLQNVGFAKSEIGIVTGYKSEMINEQGVHYFHNSDWERTNMFFSLTKASKWLRTGDCIVIYSDIVFSSEALKKLMESNYDFSITYYTGFWELWSKRFDNPLDDLETFKLQGNRLLEIGKRPVCKNDVQGQYMGLLKLSPSGWEKIEQAIVQPMPRSVEKIDITSLLSHLIELKYCINAIETSEPWFECDSQNDINVYEKFYSKIID